MMRGFCNTCCLFSYLRTQLQGDAAQMVADFLSRMIIILSAGILVASKYTGTTCKVYESGIMNQVNFVKIYSLSCMLSLQISFQLTFNI